MKTGLASAIYLVAALSCGPARAGSDLVLSVKPDRTSYQVGDRMTLRWTLANQSPRDIRVYFVDTYIAKRYLSVEDAQGRPLPAKETSVYIWENPRFLRIKAGARFSRTILGTVTARTVFGGRELRFKDVVYDLDGLGEIRLWGTFRCEQAAAEGYRKSLGRTSKESLWIGEIRSPRLTIRIAR